MKKNWRHDHKNLAEGVVQQAVVLPPNFGGRVANFFSLKRKMAEARDLVLQTIVTLKKVVLIK